MRNYSSKEYFRDCAGAPPPSLPLIFCPPIQVRQFVCGKALHGGIVHVVYVVVFDIQKLAILICPSGM